MKGIFIVIACLAAFLQALSQRVGIGTNTPKAMLQISAPDSGVLLIDNKQPLDLNAKSGIFFSNGNYITGGIETIGQGGGMYARLGLFTYANGTATTLKERLSILDNGLVGINTTTPGTTLDVNGTLRIRGGNPGAGKLLVSDANGVASWQTVTDPIVAFKAVGLIDNQTVDLLFNTPTKVIFQQAAQYNYGLGYQGIAGEFQAPQNGLYHFDVRIDLKFQSVDFVIRMMRKRNGGISEIAFAREHAFTAETSSVDVKQFSNLSISTDTIVQAGDIFWVEAISASFATLGISTTGTWFSGHMVHPL